MGISLSTTTSTNTISRNNPQFSPTPFDYFTPYYPAPLTPYPAPLATYHAHSSTPPVYNLFYDSNAYSVYNHANPVLGHPVFAPLEWQDDVNTATVVNSVVNVHRDSLRLEADELNPDRCLVTFVFDALFDGSITIYFFAKEHITRKIVPLFPETHVPIKVPFRKGLRQEFRQPLGTGIDFRFFALDDLSSPSSRDDMFPIVISAETYPFEYIVDNRSYILANELPQIQISQVAVGKNLEGQYIGKVIKQLLWSDNICYELREIYGLGTSSHDNGSGKECAICMTEPKDIAVLPCRHLCMCRECANTLSLQSNLCPICREIIEELLEIKIDDMEFDH